MPGPTTVVAIPLADTNATLDRLALIELVVSAAILVALALVAWWLVGVGLRPLRRIGETAGEIAAGDLSRRVEPANERTEVGRLGLALNAMLAQIEGAFAERAAGERRLRRFLADASHELRTPLAAIRGYAELYRIGANREPEEVERSMGRIEAESARMGGLVDDLLTLARLDEVREPERERFRLDEVLAEACEDARAAAPGRSIALDGTRPVEVERQRRAAPPRARQPAAQRGRPHASGDADRGLAGGRGGGGGGAGARPRPRDRRRGPAVGLRALLAQQRLARARRRRRRPRAGDRRRDRRRPRGQRRGRQPARRRRRVHPAAAARGRCSGAVAKST